MAVRAVTTASTSAMPTRTLTSPPASCSTTSTWSRSREVVLSIELHRRWRRSRRPFAPAEGSASGMFRSSCCASAGKSGSKPCSTIDRTAAACRSNEEDRVFTLRAAGELARFRVDPDLVALFDEERHTDLEAGLQRGDLRRSAARRVAADAWFGRRHRELHVRWKLQPDRIAVVFLHLDDHVVDEQIAGIADLVPAKRQRLETLLIHEVKPVAIGVHERRVDGVEIGLAEFVSGLEGLVEDGARQQVAHLDADERLAAPGCRLRDLDVETVVRGALELEVHFAFDVDRFNESGHAPQIVVDSPRPPFSAAGAESI